MNTSDPNVQAGMERTARSHQTSPLVATRFKWRVAVVVMSTFALANRRVVRAASILVAAAGVVLATTAPSVAAQEHTPVHGSYSFTEDFVDLEYCDFPLKVRMTESGHYTTYFNADGSEKQLVIHRSVKFVIEANGRTLLERDRFQLFITPDGSTHEVGLHTHILGEHGLVLRDAGHVLFNPDGSVEYIHGPHPQFLGQTFCSALA